MFLLLIINMLDTHLHFTGNDDDLYATMIGGRIDPSSCLDTCWVDNMAVGGFVLPVFMD